MNIPTAANMADQLARGRSRKTPLAKTNNRYITAVDNMSRNQQLWAREPGIQWQSLRRTASIPVTASNAFALPEGTGAISDSFFDKIKISHLNSDNTTEYELVEPGYLNSSQGALSNFCAIFNNQIIFVKPFKASDREFGGTIQIPHYIQPTIFVVSTPDSYQLECDDPVFLVYMAARELVAGGYVKEGRALEFYAEARRLMEKMKEANSPGEDEVRKLWSPPGRSDR